MNAFQQGIHEVDGSTHDEQRYVNALGPRGVIGIMTPGPNVNVENEMMDMRPRGVINAVDRYYVPNQKIVQNEDWSIIMRNVAANLDDSVRRLREALIDHLVLGMSSQSYMGGERGSFALLEHLQKISGLDVTMGAQSAEQAFKLCGARKIALLTPYYPVIEQNAIDYFTARGFEVVHVEGLKCKSIIHVASQTYEELAAATMRCEAAKPDAILQLGTNLAYAKVANDAEKWLRKPVFASGPVIYWSALRKMGIKDQIDGFGSLMSHH
ncbi:maleate cis-trans isomerase family protein [Cupriavidus plantarum]|uniref:Maleate isomerase n=1 Tax=Cupriavidus plantarum TaxID=942865 RepID=A0A316ES48_9BURK|nr:igiC [Cupriavidus plantarum]PWK34796.1 maleate isomerase [Cupriavidus plantarum]REE93239.1 maleate isomerase [Cupriavidus plantarum]RLK38672.1 maleate isomerase [Cupriavidus plantarum]CAG2137863.1 Maleate isomerase [Cupriavidus plantarum]SMR84998.1 maleate isomerase [Cupriavidus plantarum]